MTQSQNCFLVSRGAGGVLGPRETRPFLSTVWGTGLIQDAASAEKLKTNIHQPPPAPGPPRDARPEIPSSRGRGPSRRQRPGRDPASVPKSCSSEADPAAPHQGRTPLPRQNPNTAGDPSPPERTLCPAQDPSPPDRTLCPTGDPSPRMEPSTLPGAFGTLSGGGRAPTYPDSWRRPDDSQSSIKSGVMSTYSGCLTYSLCYSVLAPLCGVGPLHLWGRKPSLVLVHLPRFKINLKTLLLFLFLSTFLS